jgi:hypothetical protein
MGAVGCNSVFGIVEYGPGGTDGGSDATSEYLADAASEDATLEAAWYASDVGASPADADASETDASRADGSDWGVAPDAGDATSDATTLEAGNSDAAPAGEAGQADTGLEGAASDATADGRGADAYAPCTCDGGGSCFYNQTAPGPVYGVVAEVVLTPSNPTANFTAAIVGPGSGNHDSTWFDLNLSAFTSGGTISVTGTPSQCAASSFLVSECFVEPVSGGFTAIRNDSDVPPGTMWGFTYQFSPVPVLHLGTECNWSTAFGATGTNAISISVTP